LQQLRTLWSGLDPRRRLIAGLSVLAVLAALFGILHAATEPSMALLYSGLDASAAGEVVAALEAEGVPFEVSDGAILVERASRDRVRMELAGKGLPAGGPAGYEILDGLTGFGTTSQMFDAAYWRAKEGELARTITGSPNVRSARVHLANPVSQPFSRSPAGSASVTVTMARGELGRGQAEAIRYLVSSAVAGIAPEAVAVIDASRGVVLAGEEDPLAGGAGATDREATLEADIERLLEARVGPGRAIVEVNIDAAMESETVTERTIDPESRVAISSEIEESSESASGTDPGVTVASNLPDGDVSGESGNNARNATQSRERQNFEVSETRRERVIAPGQVRRISVAVMIDGVTATDAQGAPAWEPRPEAELEMLRQLVQSAIGFDAARGDVVTIQSLQFTLPPEHGALVEAGSGFLAENGARLIQLGVLAAVILALVVFVLRPLAVRRPALEITELTGPREAPPTRPRLEQPGGDILDLPPQSVTKIERLRDVIASRSEDSAAVLRSWIESPEPRKEPVGS
jgi:flagellar M-ring protein FliF